jgi:hypothetical protein
MTYIFKHTSYFIEVRQEKEAIENTIVVDGIPQRDHIIQLIDDTKDHHVVVTLSNRVTESVTRSLNPLLK